ncbi:hypothetical protein LWI28_026226 [Acer negundo]|uniref:SAC3/GANP/THP3 conserved domain-containing protein n=1 Tax=Acer negundo TaxID=4023 RepID=A0AAD5NH77_ACENE|nr:hypothetical protein LWI28_026226 [Acer negundo]
MERRQNLSSSSSSTTRFRSNRTRTSRSSNNFRPGNASNNSNNSYHVRNRRTSNQQHEEEKAERGIVGTCPFMCPEDERLQRQRLRDLAVFERLNGNPRESSPALAVKKFCRTISAQSLRASDVRPLPVLEETLSYLLDLMESAEHPFEVVHDFIFDRTRSIRQDLSMQNIVNDEVVIHMLNFMLYLTTSYGVVAVVQSSNSVYKNEAKFRSLYVLLHLDSKGQPTGESLSLWFRNLPTPIVKSKEMCFARRVLRYFRMGNYRRFFCTTSTEASYLQYCIIEPYIDEVRALALACINNCGYKLHPYPLAHLSKLLMMEESEVELFCNSCGLETSMDEVGNKVLQTKQATFCRPKGGSQRYSFLGSEQFDRQIVV